MDRRAFLGLFGKASVAAGAAASGLIGIPEAAPKIELLEEKKIVTENDPILIDKIVSFQYIRNENLRIYPELSRPIPGRIDSTIDVVVYLEGIEYQLLFAIDPPLVRFSIPEIQNKIFMVNSYNVAGQYDSVIQAQLTAVEIKA